MLGWSGSLYESATYVIVFVDQSVAFEFIEKIRGDIMGTAQKPESLDYERMYVDSLERFVTKVISMMAASTNLAPGEALDILECVQVELLGQLKSKVEVLEDDFNNEPVRRVGSAKLSWEIEKAIKAISVATDLTTDEITTIFSRKTGASIADVAYRLRRQSAHDRVSF
jgi:hypothetical protein